MKSCDHGHHAADDAGPYLAQILDSALEVGPRIFRSRESRSVGQDSDRLGDPHGDPDINPNEIEISTDPRDTFKNPKSWKHFQISCDSLTVCHEETIEMHSRNKRMRGCLSCSGR